MIGDKDRNSCFSNSALQMLMAFEEFRLVSFKIQAIFSCAPGLWPGAQLYILGMSLTESLSHS